MFEHLNTPEEIFSFKLGSALSMEKDALKTLGDLEEHSRRPELKAMFRAHAGLTQQQITNITESFTKLGEAVDDSPCPVGKALAAEGKSTLKKTDPSLADAVTLAGALESCHYGMAVYTVLVTNAEARGAQDVAALLQANLDHKTASAEEIKALAKQISTEGIAYPATAAA